MTLILTIKALDRLDNGEAARLKLDRHGARIGRSPHMDWCLPDPRSYISSAHCEIQYRDGAYLLVDRSTNGTFVNRSPSRLTAPHQIVDGDVILIGHYEIEARLEQGRGASVEEPASVGAWGGWDSHGARDVADDPARWDQPPPRRPSPARVRCPAPGRRRAWRLRPNRRRPGARPDQKRRRPPPGPATRRPRPRPRRSTSGDSWPPPTRWIGPAASAVPPRRRSTRRPGPALHGALG
jgi:type VI secretion system FHA domain protein